MELKYQGVQAYNISANGSNCTFMELKSFHKTFFFLVSLF